MKLWLEHCISKVVEAAGRGRSQEVSGGVEKNQNSFLFLRKKEESEFRSSLIGYRYVFSFSKYDIP